MDIKYVKKITGHELVNSYKYEQKFIKSIVRQCILYEEFNNILIDLRKSEKITPQQCKSCRGSIKNGKLYGCKQFLSNYVSWREINTIIKETNKFVRDNYFTISNDEIMVVKDNLQIESI